MIQCLDGAMTSDAKLTREEFIARYAKRSNVSVEYVLNHMDAYVCTCTCGETNCSGWQLLTKKGAEMARALGLIGEYDEGR